MIRDGQRDEIDLEAVRYCYVALERDSTIVPWFGEILRRQQRVITVENRTWKARNVAIFAGFGGRTWAPRGVHGGYVIVD